MVGLKIKSLTMVGDVAISRDISDGKNLGWTQRQIFNSMYQVIDTAEEGHRVRHIIVKQATMKKYLDSLEQPIIDALKENGAQPGKDFIITKVR